MSFSNSVLKLDCASEVERITGFIRRYIRQVRRKGAVVALSGGIDSSVVVALCARAVGAARVHALLMPEKESDSLSGSLAMQVVECCGVAWSEEPIQGLLDGAGCYERRTAAIRKVVPEFDEDWKCKVTLPGILEGEAYRIFHLVVESPDGERREVRLNLEAYLGILAANSFKQRSRKMLEYYYADRFHYVVAGTPNLLEYDQGFFVKGGDGLADLKPIAHLYKSQVYELAAFLELPEEVQRRTPTTDTFSLPQTQDEFYFALPYREMDLCLYALNHGIPASEVAPVVGLTAEQVKHVFADIRAKREATRYLHMGPAVMENPPA